MNQFPGGDLSNRKLKEKNRLGPRPKKLSLKHPHAICRKTFAHFQEVTVRITFLLLLIVPNE